MNKNKADIYRAMVDMSSRDVQHDAFKYIKRWWKNGKWNYEYKDESKAKSTNKSVVVKREKELKLPWQKTKPKNQRQTAEELTRQAKNHGKYVTKDPKKSSDDQSKEKSALQTYREIKNTKPTAMSKDKMLKTTPTKVEPVEKSRNASSGGSVAIKTDKNKFKDKSFLERLVDKAKSVINDSAATVKNALPERPLFDALSNVKWKTKAMSIAEDAATVNPNYDPKNPAYRENCSYCTIAYDLRRRGYDVEAKPTVPEDKEVEDDDLNIIEIMDLYKGGSIDDIRTWGEIAKEKGISKDNVDHEKAWDLIANDMTKYPDGARGHFALNWKGGGGHDIAWEKVDGKITFVDAQTNKITTQEDFLEDYILRCSNFYYMRTDHLKPSKEMLKYIKSK